MRSKQVTVELIRVVADITAAPGDDLMILNGVCIGVSTERLEQPARRPAVLHKTTQSAEPAQLPAPGKRGRLSSDTMVSRVRQVFAKAGKPLRTAEVADALGVPRDDSLGRGQVRRGVANLREAGGLRHLSGHRNSSLYELTAGGASSSAKGTE